jgi:hypothetical protein
MGKLLSGKKGEVVIFEECRYNILENYFIYKPNFSNISLRAAADDTIPQVEVYADVSRFLHLMWVLSTGQPNPRYFEMSYDAFGPAVSLRVNRLYHDFPVNEFLARFGIVNTDPRMERMDFQLVIGDCHFDTSLPLFYSVDFYNLNYRNMICMLKHFRFCDVLIRNAEPKAAPNLSNTIILYTQVSHPA